MTPIIYISNYTIKIKEEEDDEKVLSRLHVPNGYKTFFLGLKEDEEEDFFSLALTRLHTYMLPTFFSMLIAIQ